MPYLSADKLGQRVDEAGLQPISDLLHRFATGSANWLGPKVITVPPEGREQLRNLIYALLHHVGLKEFFQVTSPAPDTLVLDKKVSKRHRVQAISGTVRQEFEPGSTRVEIQEPEDMTELFSNKDPLLEPEPEPETGGNAAAGSSQLDR